MLGAAVFLLTLRTPCFMQKVLLPATRPGPGGVLRHREKNPRRRTILPTLRRRDAKIEDFAHHKSKPQAGQMKEERDACH